MQIIAAITTCILLTLFVFALRVLITKHNTFLLMGCSLVNLVAGFINGLAVDLLCYQDSTDLTEIKIYEVSAYCLYVTGLAGIVVSVIYLISRKLKHF